MASSAAKLLQNQFKKIQSDPVEGIAVELVDENLFEWKVFIEGPPETFYYPTKHEHIRTHPPPSSSQSPFYDKLRSEGGIFQLAMKFPTDYPMSPPTVHFASDFWHPNVYADGKVCISILHPPIVDEMSGELPEERWLPTQTVSTVLLSIISLLSAPNTSSPANVDASVEWRDSKESYRKRISALVQKANQSIPQYVKIPHPDTDPVERQRQVEKMKLLEKPMDLDDEDEYAYDEPDDEEYGDDDDDEEADDGVDMSDEQDGGDEED